MAPFVIFFHTGNITLDTKVHVESLKEYLDGLVGYNELRKKASKSKYGPKGISYRYTPDIRSPGGRGVVSRIFMDFIILIFLQNTLFYINNVRAYIIIFEINKFFILKLFNSKLKFIIS